MKMIRPATFGTISTNAAGITPWETMLGCLKFARVYELTTRELKPTNSAAKRILTICRKEFLRGQSNAKKRSRKT
jgi:hypothetical protein